MRELREILDDITELPEGSDVILQCRTSIGGVRFELAKEAVPKAQVLAEELFEWYSNNFMDSKFLTVSLGDADLTNVHYFRDVRE